MLNMYLKATCTQTRDASSSSAYTKMLLVIWKSFSLARVTREFGEELTVR